MIFWVVTLNKKKEFECWSVEPYRKLMNYNFIIVLTSMTGSFM